MADTSTTPADDFSARFDNFRQSLFRLETLDFYAVNGDKLDRYLAGEPLPPAAKSADWLDFVRSATAAGKTIRRVHVIPRKLTPYLRYEIEWGYLYNAVAGEDIRLIATDNPASVLGKPPLTDYWLIDDDAVGKMEYDADGAFVGTTLISDSAEAARYKHASDNLLRRALPLREFLQRERNGREL